MSATFKNIKRVKINDVEGKIGNCFVYNLSYNQGFSSSPSKLTLGLVSESASVISLPDISLQTTYQIKVDDEVVFNGYIMSKEIDESSARKTARVTLIDKSVRLDQYGIGLIRRHGASGKQISKTVNFSVNCTDCVDPNNTAKRSVSTTRTIHAGPQWSNNVLCIGEEEIAETQSAVMNVNYTNEHFQKACDLFYQKTGLKISNPPDVANKRNYTGSFRDVLNSICSDSANTFFYDPTGNDGEGAIVFVKLDSDIIVPSKKIESLKNQDDSNGGAIVIKSIRSKQTYEGTYSNHHSARFERAGKTRKVNFSRNKSIINAYKNTVGGNADYGLLARANSDLALIQYYIKYRDVGVFGANFSTNLINGAGWVNGDPNLQPDPSYGGIDGKTVVSVTYPVWWKVAEAMGISPDEMRNYLFSKPALQYGAYIYAVAMDDTLSNLYLDAWELSIKDGWQYYEAVYSPDDVERMFQQHGCNVSKSKQSPEPQKVVNIQNVGFLDRGWFFQGNTEFWTNSADISEEMAYLNPMITPITESIRSKQGFNEKYTHLIWIPINEMMSMIGSIRSGDRQHPTPCEFAPYMEIYNRTTREPCYPDEDVSVENACATVNQLPDGSSMCNPQPWKEGIICNVQAYGVSCSIGGNKVVESEGPWYSTIGFRSNLTTEVNFGSYKDKEYECTSCGGGGENFLNLKISDTDVTSQAYDPSENTDSWIDPDDPALSKSELINNSLSSTCGAHTSPLNSWSISFVGFPDNMSSILNPVGIATYNLNFGENGITVDIEFADKPKQSPTMDYFNSKQWHQRRYNI